MAKSLRSKIMRRWRKLKRGHLDNVLIKPKDSKIHENNMLNLAGVDFRPKDKPNAFLNPDLPDAHFPQVTPAPIIDLRSTSIPGSGREWSGASRKNKTVTESYKFDAADEEMGEAGVEERKEEGEGKMREEKAVTSYKVKKTRKSKLRKTIVF